MDASPSPSMPMKAYSAELATFKADEVLNIIAPARKWKNKSVSGLGDFIDYVVAKIKQLFVTKGDFNKAADKLHKELEAMTTKFKDKIKIEAYQPDAYAASADLERTADVDHKLNEILMVLAVIAKKKTKFVPAKGPKTQKKQVAWEKLDVLMRDLSELQTLSNDIRKKDLAAVKASKKGDVDTRKQVAELQSQNTALQNQVRELQQGNDVRVAQYTASMQELRTQNERLHAAVTGLRGETAQLTQTIQRQTQLLTQKDEQLKLKEDQLKQVTTAYSKQGELRTAAQEEARQHQDALQGLRSQIATDKARAEEALKAKEEAAEARVKAAEGREAQAKKNEEAANRRADEADNRAKEAEARVVESQKVHPVVRASAKQGAAKAGATEAQEARLAEAEKVFARDKQVLVKRLDEQRKRADALQTQVADLQQQLAAAAASKPAPAAEQAGAGAAAAPSIEAPGMDRAAFEQLQSRLQERDLDLAQRDSRLSEFRDLMAQQRQMIDEYVSELENLRTQLRTAQNKGAMSEAQLERYQAALNDRTAELRKLEESFRPTVEALSEQTKAMDKLDTQKTELEESVGQAADKIKELEQANQALSKQMTAILSTDESARSGLIEDLVNRLNDQIASVQDAQSDLEEADDRLKSAQAEVEQARASQRNMHQRAQRLEQQVRADAMDRNEIASKLEYAQGQLAEVEQERDKLREQLETLRDQLQTTQDAYLGGGMNLEPSHVEGLAEAGAVAELSPEEQLEEDILTSRTHMIKHMRKIWEHIYDMAPQMVASANLSPNRDRLNIINQASDEAILVEARSAIRYLNQAMRNKRPGSVADKVATNALKTQQALIKEIEILESLTGIAPEPITPARPKATPPPLPAHILEQQAHSNAKKNLLTLAHQLTADALSLPGHNPRVVDLQNAILRSNESLANESDDTIQAHAFAAAGLIDQQLQSLQGNRGLAPSQKQRIERAKTNRKQLDSAVGNLRVAANREKLAFLLHRQSEHNKALANDREVLEAPFADLQEQLEAFVTAAPAEVQRALADIWKTSNPAQLVSNAQSAIKAVAEALRGAAPSGILQNTMRALISAVTAFKPGDSTWKEKAATSARLEAQIECQAAIQDLEQTARELGGSISDNTTRSLRALVQALEHQQNAYEELKEAAQISANQRNVVQPKIEAAKLLLAGIARANTIGDKQLAVRYERELAKLPNEHNAAVLNDILRESRKNVRMEQTQSEMGVLNRDLEQLELSISGSPNNLRDFARTIENRRTLAANSYIQSANQARDSLNVLHDLGSRHAVRFGDLSQRILNVAIDAIPPLLNDVITAVKRNKRAMGNRAVADAVANAEQQQEILKLNKEYADRANRLSAIATAKQPFLEHRERYQQLLTAMGQHQLLKDLNHHWEETLREFDRMPTANDVRTFNRNVHSPRREVEANLLSYLETLQNAKTQNQNRDHQARLDKRIALFTQALGNIGFPETNEYPGLEEGYRRLHAENLRLIGIMRANPNTNDAQLQEALDHDAYQRERSLHVGTAASAAAGRKAELDKAGAAAIAAHRLHADQEKALQDLLRRTIGAATEIADKDGLLILPDKLGTDYSKLASIQVDFGKTPAEVNRRIEEAIRLIERGLGNTITPQIRDMIGNLRKGVADFEANVAAVGKTTTEETTATVRTRDADHLVSLQMALRDLKPRIGNTVVWGTIARSLERMIKQWDDAVNNTRDLAAASAQHQERTGAETAALRRLYGALEARGNITNQAHLQMIDYYISQYANDLEKMAQGWNFNNLQALSPDRIAEAEVQARDIDNMVQIGEEVGAARADLSEEIETSLAQVASDLENDEIANIRTHLANIRRMVQDHWEPQGHHDWIRVGEAMLRIINNRLLDLGAAEDDANFAEIREDIANTLEQQAAVLGTPRGLPVPEARALAARNIIATAKGLKGLPADVSRRISTYIREMDEAFDRHDFSRLAAEADKIRLALTQLPGMETYYKQKAFFGKSEQTKRTEIESTVDKLSNLTDQLDILCEYSLVPQKSLPRVPVTSEELGLAAAQAERSEGEAGQFLAQAEQLLTTSLREFIESSFTQRAADKNDTRLNNLLTSVPNPDTLVKDVNEAVALVRRRSGDRLPATVERTLEQLQGGLDVYNRIKADAGSRELSAARLRGREAVEAHNEFIAEQRNAIDEGDIQEELESLAKDWNPRYEAIKTERDPAKVRALTERYEARIELEQLFLSNLVALLDARNRHTDNPEFVTRLQQVFEDVYKPALEDAIVGLRDDRVAAYIERYRTQQNEDNALIADLDRAKQTKHSVGGELASQVKRIRDAKDATKDKISKGAAGELVAMEKFWADKRTKSAKTKQIIESASELQAKLAEMEPRMAAETGLLSGLTRMITARDELQRAAGRNPKHVQLLNERIKYYEGELKTLRGLSRADQLTAKAEEYDREWQMESELITILTEHPEVEIGQLPQFVLGGSFNAIVELLNQLTPRQAQLFASSFTPPSKEIGNIIDRAAKFIDMGDVKGLQGWLNAVGTTLDRVFRDHPMPDAIRDRLKQTRGHIEDLAPAIAFLQKRR